MERVRGSSRWRLTFRREPEGIVLLRAVTCERQAALPEELFGLPVIALGDHALAPSAKPAEGERVEITCGPAPREWDNASLERLTLPPSLKRVGDYALMSCRGLRELELWDGVESWGCGALMNCALLGRFTLHREGETFGPSLACFADELSGELDMTVLGVGGTEFRLLLPDYVESYEENGPAHHFDYKIYGAGHPYHHIFRQKQPDLRAYDGLWPQFLREDHDRDAALRMARYRLRWPAELSGDAKARYTDYLRERCGDLLFMQIGEDDLSGAAWAARELSPGEPVLRGAAEHARRLGRTAILALLMERLRQSRPSGLQERFEL